MSYRVIVTPTAEAEAMEALRRHAGLNAMLSSQVEREDDQAVVAISMMDDDRTAAQTSGRFALIQMSPFGW